MPDEKSAHKFGPYKVSHNQAKRIAAIVYSPNTKLREAVSVHAKVEGEHVSLKFSVTSKLKESDAKRLVDELMKRTS